VDNYARSFSLSVRADTFESRLRSIKKLPAEKEGHKIAVEIKDFDAPSVISELEKQMQRR